MHETRLLFRYMGEPAEAGFQKKRRCYQ